MKNWSLSLFATLAVASAVGCSKKTPPAPAPAPAATAPATDKAIAPAAAATPANADKVAAPADGTKGEAAPAEADPLKNAWNLPARGTSAKEGGRVFVLTQGKDRSYTNASAIYHLFAYDLGEIKKGDVMTVKELGSGTFQVTGLFLIAAGTDNPADLKAGDMVLAEWASSLKHATVTKVDGDKINVRYTDLPDSWSEDKLIATLSPRQVTKQKDGLSPGNFAVAKDDDGRMVEVMLISDSGDKWLARKFAGRVAAYDTKDLTPIPIKPAVKAGQSVQVPWVGMMYPGKIKKVSGNRVEVIIEGTATKEAQAVPIGQILPESKDAKGK